MNTQKSEIGVFILARDEQQNIGRCLEALRASAWDVIVLDSGSSDDTPAIVAGFGFAEFRQYAYADHCTAYNQITTELGVGYRYTIILDADMVISDALQHELNDMLSSRSSTLTVVDAEILMCVEGNPLRFGSLYPPKPFVFAAGREYFVSVGHGEKLKDGITAKRTREKLRHDDRKSYASYLLSQVRYSRNLVHRKVAGEVSGRDKLRTRSPLLIFAVPFVSYLVKGGFLSGKAGAIYALDRIIAEAIMYRRSLSGVQND